MAGIEEATAAFETDLGGKSSGINERAHGPESIFDNSRSHENDKSAGGDDEDDEEVVARRTKPADDGEETPVVLGDDDEDDEEEVDPDAEPKDDEDDEEEEDAENSAILDKKFVVMVDGDEEEVTGKEALEGYIRTKTFHKRMNQIDRVRQELVVHSDKIIADRKQYDEMLAEAEELIGGILPKEPEWDKLFAEDPKAARELQKQYDSYRGKISEIKERRAKSAKDLSEKQQKEAIEYAKTEYPKFAQAARWKTKEDQQKDLTSMRRTALAVGFSEDEVAQVLDSRMLTILLKASKFDRMMAARPKAVKDGKTPIKPGAGKQTARRGVNGDRQRLARTGSVEDAAQVMKAFIK